MRISPRVAPLTSSIALAIALSACGGGGGNTRSDPPPPPAPPAPVTPPPPAVCEDAAATNPGAPLPCTYRYNGLQDNILVPINADLAHKAGFTGKGVKVGVLDDAYIEGYAPLEGAVAWQHNYVTDKEMQPGHGNLVATVLAGRATAGFSGGVAPDASIYWGQVCDAGCNTVAARDAILDMAAEGVRIFNASFGGVSTGGEPSQMEMRHYASMFSVLKGVDGLLVSSAGNTGNDAPGSLPAMPLIDRDLADHYIVAAAGTVDSKGNVTELADYSNKCGFAAEWCIAAPGRHVVPAIGGTEYQYGGNGTSSSTAAVTGTAALVQQAFPWMSARNLQQTVLTTATDLGAEGVDAVFGWGLLNADRAVRGPAVFTGADFAADVGSGRYVFGNDISGDKGIIKDGAGTLELAGVNTFTGASSVLGGELIAMRGLGGSVTVHDGAALTAGGTVRGDFTAHAGATTTVALGNALVVGGVANLDGDLRLLNAAEGYEVGATETILSAASIDGTFDNLLIGSGFFWDATLNYGATQVTASLTRAPVASKAMAAGASRRVVEGGQQADALFRTTDSLPSGQQNSLVKAAGRLASTKDQMTAELALASLTGEVHGTARAAAVGMAISDAVLFGDRVATLNPADAGVWVQGTAMDAEFARDGFAAADVRHSGLTVGVDRAVADLALVGVALSAGRGRGELDALGGRYDSDHTGATLYGRAALPTGYVSASFGLTRQDVDARRAVLLGDEAAAIHGTHEDDVWTMRVEAGNSYGAFTPFVAGGYVRHDQGAMLESGGEGLALRAGGNDATVHFGEAGVRFAHSFNRLTLRGVLAGRWTGGDTRPAYTASFVDAPETDLTIYGQSIPSNTYRASVGVEYRATPNVIWSLAIGGESGAGDSSNATASGGLRISF